MSDQASSAAPAPSVVHLAPVPAAAVDATRPSSLVDIVHTLFMVINVRLLAVLAVLGAWGIWGWAVIVPQPWSWAAGVGYSLGVVVPVVWLHGRKEGP